MSIYDTLNPVYPQTRPRTQAEFDTRYAKLVGDWTTVLGTGDPAVELEVYPSMIAEAKALVVVCSKPKGLRDMIETLQGSLG